MPELLCNPYNSEFIPIPVAEIPDPRQGTPAYEAAVTRAARSRSFDGMPWITTPGEEPERVYGAISAAEREVASPWRLTADYERGIATKPDDVLLIDTGNDRPVIFTAEHATMTIRAATGEIGHADVGTGGLAAVLGRRFGQAYIMTGRQTGNAATDERHPLKDAVAPALPRSRGLISVHGMNSGLLTHPLDPTEVHAAIGLGDEPGEELLDFAHGIANYGRRTLGLHVIVGYEQPHFVQKKPTALRRDKETGALYTNRLAGLRPTTMVSHLRHEYERLGGRQKAVQIELTKLLRLTSIDRDKRARRDRVTGVALGHALLTHVAEQMAASTPGTPDAA